MKISDKLFLIKRDLRKKISLFVNTEIAESKDKRENTKKKEKRNERVKADFYEVKLNSLTKNSLLYFSLIISIGGIVFLIILSSLIAPKPILLENLKSVKDGSYVSFVGYITSIRESYNTLLITVCDSLPTNSQKSTNSSKFINCAEVRVMPYSDSYLLIGDFVSVTGKTFSFNGKQYISVSSIKDIKVLS